MDELPEMRGKGILSLNRQEFAVKASVLIKILTEDPDGIPSFFEGIGNMDDIQFVFLDQFHKFRIEGPVCQIILIPEMIIEALSIHVAFFADIGNTDFLKGLIFH